LQCDCAIELKRYALLIKSLQVRDSGADGSSDNSNSETARLDYLSQILTALTRDDVEQRKPYGPPRPITAGTAATAGTAKAAAAAAAASGSNRKSRRRAAKARNASTTGAAKGKSRTGYNSTNRYGRSSSSSSSSSGSRSTATADGNDSDEYYDTDDSDDDEQLNSKQQNSSTEKQQPQRFSIADLPTDMYLRWKHLSDFAGKAEAVDVLKVTSDIHYHDLIFVIMMN
jgi:hypothetical protein